MFVVMSVIVADHFVCKVLMETDLSGEQGHSVQAWIQWGEANCDQLIHFNRSSWHGTWHNLTLKDTKEGEKGGLKKWYLQSSSRKLWLPKRLWILAQSAFKIVSTSEIHKLNRKRILWHVNSLSNQVNLATIQQSSLKPHKEAAVFSATNLMKWNKNVWFWDCIVLASAGFSLFLFWPTA